MSLIENVGKPEDALSIFLPEKGIDKPVMVNLPQEITQTNLRPLIDIY